MTATSASPSLRLVVAGRRQQGELVVAQTSTSASGAASSSQPRRPCASLPISSFTVSATCTASSNVTCSSRRVAGSKHGLAQLVGIHLAEALEARHVLARAAPRLERLAQLVLGADVHVGAVGERDAEQRRLRQEHAALGQQAREQLVEQRDQQVADVRAVGVGVAGEHDLAVAQLVDLERRDDGLADRVLAAAQRDQDRVDLGVLERAAGLRAEDVQDLAADGQDRLQVRVAGLLRGAAGGVALDDEDLALQHRHVRVVERVGELARQVRVGEDRRRRVAQLLRDLGLGDADVARQQQPVEDLPVSFGLDASHSPNAS